jgi:hypothetical protein
MLRPIRCAFLFASFAPLAAPAAAQFSLPGLQQQFARQRDELYRNGALPTQEQETALLKQQVETLQKFVAGAKGEDRWNGCLMLADLRLGLRDRSGAKEALGDIDADAAPPLVLLTAADMFGRLGEKEQRDKLVARALEKDAPLAERMAMARVLMTALREVKKGEQIFTDALAQAKDDEARAYVRWNHADALRQREDLPDNAFNDALEQLSRDLPNTYFGCVAHDRNLASQFKLGGDPIPFTVKTTENTTVDLAALHGRAVLLVFWASGDERSKGLIDALAPVRKRDGDDLFALGIGLDADPKAFARNCTQLGATFLQVCDGKGWMTDLALRYGVEVVPTMIAIDRKGKLAGLNLHVDNKEARDELDAALQRALARE